MADRVIIIPGFMGSALVRRGNDTPSGLVWINRQRLLTGEYRYLQLDDAGTGPGPLAQGVELVPSKMLVQPGPWSAVINRLSEADFDVRFWAYDWRMDIRPTAIRLAATLVEEAARGPFYVLAYSLGGLIARLAYGHPTAEPARAMWRRTLYLASPHFGSHEAAMYLARAFRDLSLLGIYPPALAGYTTVSSIAGLASVLNVKVQPVISSWPALYQLLPDISADWVSTRPLDPKLYQAATYRAENPYVRQVWFDGAAQTRAALNATLSGPRPAERIALGGMLDTPDALLRSDELGFEDDYRVVDGDGSVTEARGTLPGVSPSLTMSPGLHVDLPADGRFLAALPTLLRDTVVESGIKGEIIVPPMEPVPGSPVVNLLPGPGTGVQRRGDP